MEFINGQVLEKEFYSTRKCSFCNSKEGKLRMVGNYVVKLSKAEFEGQSGLACQSCRIKKRNIEQIKKTSLQNEKKSLLKNLFGLGFRRKTSQP